MSFDVLSRNLNVFSRHFLEASAGTGKTFAIEHLVVRLLIENDQPLSIEQILVVTFTRAAARELKMRIRRTLYLAKEELSKGCSSFDYLQAICEKGHAAILSALEKIHAALICFDAAQIYTLHRFCHRILNEFAFEAGLVLNVSDPDEEYPFLLFEQIVKDYLQEGVKFPDYSPFQVQSVLKSFRNKPKKMIQSLIDLSLYGRDIRPPLKDIDLLTGFVKEIRRLPSIDPRLLKQDLERMIPCYKQMTEENISEQIDMLCELLTSKNCTLNQFDHLLKGECFLRKMVPENKKVRVKFPEASSLHYPGLIERMQKSLLPWIKQAKNPSRTLFCLAHDLQKKGKAILEQKEQFSPDTLLKKVEAALAIPGFVQRIQQKYRAAIIDEFQDTDPVQWNIFQTLFLSDLKVIYLVGDPKQSIYAFRHADIYTYFAATNSLGESAKKSLDTNFRSSQKLVEALNRLFSQAEGKWIHLPQDKTQTLKVVAVKAGATIAVEDKDSPPLQFFIAQGKKGRNKKFPTQEMLEKKFFPFIASKIVELHREKQVNYHEIAILIKDRYQGQAIIQYLKERGIPAYSKRGPSILESSAYFALKDILRAVCSPSDMNRLKIALGSAVIGWTESQLRIGFEDPLLLEAKAQMQWLQQILFQKGFSPFFQTFLKTPWGSKKPLLQELLHRGDLPMYLELRKIAELLIEAEMTRRLNAQGLLSFLEEIERKTDHEESWLKIPQEEQGGVTIITMHMSKGLEFEAVFALGIASRHLSRDRMIIREDDRSWTTFFDPENPLCLKAMEEQDAEKMRQLYVALTRAKRYLYVPVAIEDSQAQVEYGEAAPIELFFAKAIHPLASYQELYAMVPTIDLAQISKILEDTGSQIHVLNDSFAWNLTNKEEPHFLSLRPPRSLHLPPYEGQVFSFTSLSKKEKALHPFKLTEQTDLSPHTLPQGSDTGYLLHRLLEKIFKRGLHHPLNERAVSLLIDELLAFSSLDAYRLVIFPWIVSLLRKSLPGGFCLCDIPSKHILQEMEFFFPLSPTSVMKGFADLVFDHQGKYYLLDWKSHYLGPSDTDYTPDAIAQVMRQQNYDLQASIYTEALQRFVKLFDNRPFSDCFGGAIYYFIRGQAVYHFIPNPFKGLSHEI